MIAVELKSCDWVIKIKSACEPLSLLDTVGNSFVCENGGNERIVCFFATYNGTLNHLLIYHFYHWRVFVTQSSGYFGTTIPRKSSAFVSGYCVPFFS